MTRDETKKIVMIIASTYPNWHPSDLSFTVDAWALVLESYTYQEIGAALKAYILTDSSGFAPSPGQLVGLLDKGREEADLNEMDAWSLVSKALRNGYYGAEQEFAQLPEMVQKAVGSPSNLRNWSQTDMYSVENVIMSNFMRSYRQVVERSREMRKLPEDIRTLLTRTVSGMIEQDEALGC